ncbi:MAG TPA: twin-arginine translocase TatA/TatE family subunit [Acidimicrobiales bacterium]|nr:twin-arginine translocase TatA/TatE family subunit [Acidimicrobiales bacterium]
MHFSSPAEIFGVDGIIVLIVVVLVLFGSTQIPKLARSLGSAQKEFKKGVDHGAAEDGPGAQVAAASPSPSAVHAPAQTVVVVESIDPASVHSAS